MCLVATILEISNGYMDIYIYIYIHMDIAGPVATYSYIFAVHEGRAGLLSTLGKV